MAEATSRTNGFQLIEIVMKHCMKAFDSNEVEMEWPKYMNYNNVFTFGQKMLQTAKLAAKKGQVLTDRTVAITFLNSIRRDAGDVYSFAALMKKNEIESLPPNQPLPPKYQLMLMAKEISDSKPGGNNNTQAKNTEHTIYKSAITNQAQPHPSQATQTNTHPSQATQTNTFNDNPYVNPYNGTHLNGILQGATREQYIANQTYRPG
jgi:hypothetical protein